MGALAAIRRILGRPSPKPARHPARLAVRNLLESYEAGSTGRRSRGWLPSSAGPNDSTLLSLETLRARARAASRNDGWAKKGLASLVTNIVGVGIKPLSQAADLAFRAAVQELWRRWAVESDADGRLSVNGQQALAVRTWLDAGEVFVRLRYRRLDDGLSVPLQLQILEPDLVPVRYNDTKNGNLIRAGIEFDPIGRRAAYWMYRQRPGALQDLDVSELVRVPAEAVLHVYDPVRAGQLRGLPHLTQALVKLRDLNLFDDATLLRQQLANLFVGFLKRASNPGGEGETTDPLQGKLVVTDGDRPPLVGMEPGIWQELYAGEDVTFSDPPDVGETYAAFMRQQLLAVAVAIDVPYELLTGDLSKVNDRVIRVVLNEFRRAVEAWQDHLVIHQLCRPVWEAFLDQAVLAGALDPPPAYFADASSFRRVKWVPQGWRYIHPVQDSEAQENANRDGYKSRSQIIAEMGGDAEEIEREIAADNARADALGLRFDSDGRQPANARPGSADPVIANLRAGPAPGLAASPPIHVEIHSPAAPARRTTVERRPTYDAQGRVIHVHEERRED